MNTCSVDRPVGRPLGYLLEYMPVNSELMALNPHTLSNLHTNVQCIARFASACDVNGVADPELRRQALEAIAQVRLVTEQLTPALKVLILLHRLSASAPVSATAADLQSETRDRYCVLIAAAHALMQAVNPALAFEFNGVSCELTRK